MGDVIAEGAAVCRAPRGREEAEYLVGSALGMTPEQLFLARNDEVEGEGLARARGFFERRALGEPVAYIVGWQEFYGWRFRVTRDVLIPRSETELLVDRAREVVREGMRVVDVGTGSGCIAVSIARMRHGVRVCGCDVSVAALAVARENAERAGVEVEWCVSDVLTGVQGGVDVVVANLPYIPEGDVRVEAGVAEYEPHGALYAGVDGLDVYRRLLVQARERGALVLLCEVGEGQREGFEGIAGGYEVVWHRDGAGIERVAELRVGG